MRIAPLAAAVLMLSLWLPSAGAAASSVSLSGPSSLTVDGPTSATLGVALHLEGVVCAGDAEIPVLLRIAEASGVRGASLAWDRVVFRVASHAAVRSWSGESQVALRILGAEGAGRVVVAAAYDLPASCVAPGAAHGETERAIEIQGAPAASEREPPAPAVPKAEVQPPPAPAPAPSPSLAPAAAGAHPPLALVGAFLGALAGGAVVLAQRLRRAPSTPAP
ncbi:MAG TPA: hypothetical protein VM370_02135 [Candidatus Thermoplasmatota archaeon]|nr:hypothetical protein [Candidatus Thermoplasmatota archaeon]